MGKPVPFIIIYFAFLYVHSQSKIERQNFWFTGINVGAVGWSPTSIQNSSSVFFSRVANTGTGMASDINGKKRLIIVANTSIGVNGGYLWRGNDKAKQTALLFELQNNKASYSFRYPFSYKYKGDTVGLWVDADNYLKYSIGIMRTLDFIRGRDDNPYYIKVSFGQTFFHREFDALKKAGDEEDWTDNGTGMKLRVLTANENSGIVSVELGKKFLFKSNNNFDFGIVCHKPIINTKVIEYEFFKSNVSLGKSTVTYYGATVMLNATYNFNFRVKRKPVDSVKASTYRDLAMDTGKQDSEPKLNRHRINGRKFEVQQSLASLTSEIILLIWDKNKVDGDEVSLYLNGECILENYTVSKKKKELKIKLQSGSNILVMHALNLGRVPPNTAALSVDDGNTKKIITLVSSLDKSGAIEIIYSP